jgi:drug/metabolite transporter (DMT)-like permease
MIGSSVSLAVERYADRYVIFALLSAISMASSGVIARLSGIAAAELTFYRLAVGALCLWLFVCLRGQAQQLKQKPDWRMALNGVMLASFMLAFLKAINYISLANAIMLVYLAPPLSALIAHFFFAEKLDFRSSSLIAVSFFGFAMMQEFKLDLVVTPSQWPGFCFGILSLLTYTAFLLLNRHVTSSHSQFQRTFYQLLIGACCVLPFLADASLPTADDWLWIVLAGFFPGFLAIYFAVLALERLPTKVFGTLAYIEPVTVILAGWWLFGEALSTLKIAGVVLILTAGALQAFNSQGQQSKS